MASTDLTRTHTVATADERKKHTFSAWIKLSNIGSDSNVFFANRPANNYRFYYMIMNSGGGGNTVPNAFYCYMVYNGSEMLEASGTRKLRDPNAWYHIVVRTDTTQANASDRFRVYINGEQDSVTLHHAPDQDEELQVNRDTTHYIGEEGNGNGQFNGSMSHIHFCDGYSYAPTEFGSTDSTTGEWKINTSPNVQYGTNGFFILKDGNSVTDQSGNSHNWTVNAGTLTKTEDCPSHIFNTFNPLVPKHSNLTLLHGNTTLSSTNSQWLGSMTTIPLFGGKWYYECKYNTGYNIKLSIMGYKSDLRHFTTANNSYGEYNDNGYGYQFNNSGNDYLGNNASTPNWAGGLSSNTGDKIYMIAINLENGKIWYGADGTWFNDASGYTGNPTTDAYPHQTISATHLAQKPFVVTGSVEGNGASAHWNFGNGYFGTTAISSEGTNASGIGKFEFDVPTGFTAISTKGLNE